MNIRLKEDLNRLNTQQSEIVKKFSGSSVIVAGPGTGKTRTVSVLIGALLEKKLRLREILALTFSDKAAAELKERVLEYFPGSFDECWISTFHSFCARLLRENYFLVGIQPDFKLLTGFKEALLLSEICKKQQLLSYSYYGKVLIRRGFQQEVLSFISLLKSNLVSPEHFASAISQSDEPDNLKERLLEINSLYVLYENEREKAGYLDFRDLISLAIKALSFKNVADNYQNKFKTILVDEFQDTDPAQFLLLTLLKGSQNDIKVIGDPFQSIYRFRGADPSMMAKNGPFLKKFKSKIFKLETNYRSAVSIVELSKKLHWHDKNSLVSYQVPASSNEGFIHYFHLKDELDEARVLSRKIASLIIYGDKKKYKPEDIAVLVRNNYQIDLIAECLQTLNIDFEIAGDMKFFKSEEVIVLSSLLKSVTDSQTQKQDALERAFASPIFKIDSLWVQAVLSDKSTQMTTLIEKISDNDFDSLPEADEHCRARALFFAETIKIIENSENTCLQTVFARLLLAFQELFEDPTAERASNLLIFRNMISDYSELFEKMHKKVPLVKDLMLEFDEWLTYYASTLEQESKISGSGVKIMTVHQSKGLEFPVVVVCGLSEGLFPVSHRENLLVSTPLLEKFKKWFDKNDSRTEFFNPYPVTYQEHLEEERRLFYVALTRAQEGLILSSIQINNSQPVIRSPFIGELKLKATKQEEIEDQRPLTAGEFRTLYSKLKPETQIAIEPLINKAESVIPEEFCVHGLKARSFKKNVIDQVTLPENFKLSASSIKNFVDCPRRFYFLNILKIADPLLQKQPVFAVGNAFHDCLEVLHDPKDPWLTEPQTHDIDKIFNSKAEPYLKELDFFQRHLETEKIKTALIDYCHAVYNCGQLPCNNTTGVEHDFRFSFDNVIIGGRFDRLITNQDEVIVVDYKTGQNKSAEKIFSQAFCETDLPQEIQVPLYLLACLKMGFKKISVCLLYVKQPLYKKKYKQMQAGYLKAAAFNYGPWEGAGFGVEVTESDMSIFCKRLSEIITSIINTSRFDCFPSNAPEARTCINNQKVSAGCEFYAFCQERLEQLRTNRLTDTDEPSSLAGGNLNAED